MGVSLIATLAIFIFVIEYNYIGLTKHFLYGDKFIKRRGDKVLAKHYFKKVVVLTGKGSGVVSSVFHRTHAVFNVVLTTKSIFFGRTLLASKYMYSLSDVVDVKIKIKYKAFYKLSVYINSDGMKSEFILSDIVILNKQKCGIEKMISDLERIVVSNNNLEVKR